MQSLRQQTPRTFFLERLPYPSRNAPKEAKEEYGKALKIICDVYTEVLNDYAISIESIIFTFGVPYKSTEDMNEKIKKRHEKNLKIFSKLYQNYISQKSAVLTELGSQAAQGYFDPAAKIKLEKEIEPLKKRLKDLTRKIFPQEGTILGGKEYSFDDIQRYFELLNESPDKAGEKEPINAIAAYCFFLGTILDNLIAYAQIDIEGVINALSDKEKVIQLQQPDGLESRTMQALNSQQSQISIGNVAAESRIYENILKELLKYTK